MVFSNEEMQKLLNLKELDNNKSDLDYILRQEKYRPVNVEQQFNEFVEKHYYTGRFDGLDEKYGISPDTLALFLLRMTQYHIADDFTLRNAIRERFNKVREDKELDIYEGYERFTYEYSYLGLAPSTALYYIKFKLLAEASNTSIIDWFLALIPQAYEETYDYFKKANKPLVFDDFKKDVLDKDISMQEKLFHLLGYLAGSRVVCADHYEKKAIDYYLEKSTYLNVLQNHVTDEEVERAGRETKKWLKAHRSPEAFLDFTKLPSIKEKIKVICQLMDIMGFSTFASFYYSMDEEILQRIMAVLNKYSHLYNNDKNVRDLLIYFCYATYNCISSGNSYVEEYLNEAISKEVLRYTAIEKLDENKRDAEKMQAQLKSKQDSLNKIQLDYDRLKNKELAKLKEELEKQKQLQKELQEKINYLEEINSSLEANIEEMEAAVAPSSSISNKPNSYVESKLKSLNILVMGGHQIWQNRLKEIYPYFTYIDSDNVNFDINITRNADIIFFNTLHCSHTLYYRIKNNVNNGRTNNKEKIVLVSSNNLDYFKDIVSKTLFES